MKIRQAKSADIDDITHIISTAFLIPDYHGLRENLIDNPRYSFRDIIVVEDGVDIVACVKIIPLKVSFKNKIVDAGGISAVAVLPEYRRRGIADMMLKDALKRMFNAKDFTENMVGNSLALLCFMKLSHQIYRCLRKDLMSEK